MGRNRCNNGVWRRDSTASAPRSPPRVPRARPRRRRRAPRRARTGSSAARTSPRTPPTAPQWQESGYLGRCIFKGSFSEAQCKDMGRQYPRRPGRVQVRGERRQVRHESEGPGVFVEQAVLRGDGVAPRRKGGKCQKASAPQRKSAGQSTWRASGKRLAPSAARESATTATARGRIKQ